MCLPYRTEESLKKLKKEKCPLSHLCKYYREDSKTCNDKNYLFLGSNKIHCGQLNTVFIVLQKQVGKL